MSAAFVPVNAPYPQPFEAWPRWVTQLITLWQPRFSLAWWIGAIAVKRLEEARGWLAALPTAPSCPVKVAQVCLHFFECSVQVTGQSKVQNQWKNIYWWVSKQRKNRSCILTKDFCPLMGRFHKQARKNLNKITLYWSIDPWVTLRMEEATSAEEIHL